MGEVVTPMDTQVFVEGCTACGVCLAACPFLARYGLPKNIVTDRPRDAFLCTNCGACDALCPEGLSPSKALHMTKQHLVRTGDMPETVQKALASARSFASTGHVFPFVYYARSDTVFWPGCSLAATSPEVVKKTIGLLKESIGQDVGLVLDCCGDPPYELGDVGTTERALTTIQRALEKNRVTRVITGCANCQKILSRSLKGMTVEHVLTVLPGALNLPRDHRPLFLHHPCPVFGEPGLKEALEAGFFKENGSTGVARVPLCCGYGGNLMGIDAKLSQEFAQRAVQAAKGQTVVTYCMGCKKSFMEEGARSIHVLELATGVRPLEQPVSQIRGWYNRLLLSLGRRLRNKRLILGLCIIVLIGLAFYLRHTGYFSVDHIMAFLEAHPVLAPVLFILVYGVAPSLLLPAIPLSLAAGFLWGPVWGVVFSITGATIGASLSFFIARYVMADAVRSRFGEEKWRAIRETVEKHGWKAVAFARLVPVLPFNMLNYIFGITPIPFRHYLWCTFVFMLPGCVAFVAFGNSMGDIAKGDIRGLIIGLVAASAALLLPVALRPLIKRFFGDHS